jgi:hypothetical protein
MLTDTPPRLIPLGPCARRLRVPSTWLRQEAEAGRVPHLRAGKAILFDLETVERVLLERARREGVEAAEQEAKHAS